MSKEEEEFELKIEQIVSKEGLSDEGIEAYKNLVKRVQGDIVEAFIFGEENELKGAVVAFQNTQWECVEYYISFNLNKQNFSFKVSEIEKSFILDREGAYRILLEQMREKVLENLIRNFRKV